MPVRLLMSNQPVILMPPLRVTGLCKASQKVCSLTSMLLGQPSHVSSPCLSLTVGAVGNTNLTCGIVACSIGPKSAQPRPVSPNPCRIMTVAVCLVLLGKERGFGYCQCVCIACADLWECLDNTCLPVLGTADSLRERRRELCRAVEALKGRTGLEESKQAKER